MKRRANASTATGNVTSHPSVACCTNDYIENKNGGDVLLLVMGSTRRHQDTDAVGHLVVPAQRNKASSLRLRPRLWAMDNGAYTGLDVAAYMRMLEQFMESHCRAPCLFVTAPDVVADADATLAMWPFWSRVLRGLGYPVAFVLQDGIGTRTPWPECDAVFVGGSTYFKLSGEVRCLMGLA